MNKSTIATSPSQSQRLIACGVDPKTADMVWLCRGQFNPPILSFNEGCNRAIQEVGDIPAYSLSRLLDIVPAFISDGDDRDNEYVFQLDKGKKHDGSCVWELAYYDPIVKNNYLYYDNNSNLIEACVKAIEWLTKNNYQLNEIEE